MPFVPIERAEHLVVDADLGEARITHCPRIVHQQVDARLVDLRDGGSEAVVVSQVRFDDLHWMAFCQGIQRAR